MKYFIAAAVTGGAGTITLCLAEIDFLNLFGLALVGIGILFLIMSLICLTARLIRKPRPSSALMFAIGDAVLMAAICIYAGYFHGLFPALLLLYVVPTLGIVFFAALSIWLSQRSKVVREDHLGQAEDPDQDKTEG
ncbi:MAG: hypothetical protein IJR91_05590 [Ruminococcus sp.]|nr:hypothetical protein [Ruminococcus sp.]